jgi:hypothetical protein
VAQIMRLYRCRAQGAGGKGSTNLMIVDISDVPGSLAGTDPAPVGTAAPVTDLAEGNWNQFFPGAADPAACDFDLGLHSMAPTADGKKTNLAYLRGGFGVLDTSAVVRDTDDHFISLNDKLITPVQNFLRWGTGNQCAGHTAAACSESHSPCRARSAVRAEHRRGVRHAHRPSFGWPWGWARLTNVANPTRPDLTWPVSTRFSRTHRRSKAAPATIWPPSSSPATRPSIRPCREASTGQGTC